MNALTTAVAVELQKALASRVLRSTAVLMVAGVALLCGALVGAAGAGNGQVLDQLGPLGHQTGWPLLGGIAAQITAAGGLLAFGVALSWSVGREFTDGTIVGLFALPVPRSHVAVAKLVVHVLWCAAVAVALTVALTALGLALGLGPLDGAVLGQLGRQLGLGLLTGLVATPAAWAATLGRGLLPGVATTVGLIVAAQVAVVAAPGRAGWFPLAAPALWGLRLGEVGPPQLALVALVPLAAGALTALAWQRLQLDR
jgi:ABC-2 type transport system permease protein